MSEWIRARFKANYPDFRPVTWPPPGPFWRSGIGGDDSYSIVIAYVRSSEQIQEFWPEARDIETTEEESIKFTDRFPKPDWWEDAHE
jgi:hypothetical protein